MANFKTHITVATTVSGLLASSCLALDLLPLMHCMGLWALGSLAGILPDIDSDTSDSLRSVFSMMGVMTVIMTVIAARDYMGMIPLWALMLMNYALVRYGLLKIFAVFTHHRGIFHSLAASLFFALLTAFIMYQLKPDDLMLTGLASIFMFVGYTLHLTLDELYSVDLSGMSIKRSFGSAIKPLSLRNWLGSSVMIVLSLVFLWYLPSTSEFLSAVLLKEGGLLLASQPVQAFWGL